VEAEALLSLGTSPIEFTLILGPPLLKLPQQRREEVEEEEELGAKKRLGDAIWKESLVMRKEQTG
jgi:hypothetical protein